MLELASLERRLRDAGAIGVLAKPSLEKQVDELVDRFKASRASHRPPTLPGLRRLLVKFLWLLQDAERSGARCLLEVEG